MINTFKITDKIVFPSGNTQDWKTLFYIQHNADLNTLAIIKSLSGEERFNVPSPVDFDEKCPFSFISNNAKLLPSSRKIKQINGNAISFPVYKKTSYEKGFTLDKTSHDIGFFVEEEERILTFFNIRKIHDKKGKNIRKIKAYLQNILNQCDVYAFSDNFTAQILSVPKEYNTAFLKSAKADDIEKLAEKHIRLTQKAYYYSLKGAESDITNYYNEQAKKEGLSVRYVS